GIPVSIFGAASYLLIILLLLNETRFSALKEIFLQIAFGISLTGFIYSIYLTYLEIAVIKAICPFCVVSAIMMTILLICNLIRLVQNQNDTKLILEEKNG
ncbi:MAG TPA: vitamin K epoxide reductase family protein, partial [Leptolinea sp.]